MKVRDLVALLQAQNQDALVVLDTGSDWQHIVPHSVPIDNKGRVEISANPRDEDEED